MRMYVLPLWALFVSLTIAAQTSAPASENPSTLLLPARLEKTVRAEKIAAGSVVKFRLEEPVLLEHGVVVPEGAQLRGRVLDAARLGDGTASRLAIVVDQMEWKHNVVPLRAYINGVVAVREVFRQKQGDWRCQQYVERQTASRGEKSTRGNPVATPMPRPMDCGNNPWTATEERVIRDRGADLKDIVLHRSAQDGSTFLFSQRKNVHLPSGTVLILKNVPQSEAEVGLISQK